MEKQQFIQKLYDLTQSWLPEVISLHQLGLTLGERAQRQIIENDFGGLLNSLEQLGNILLSLEYHNQKHMKILEEKAEEMGISDLLKEAKSSKEPSN